MFNEDVFTSFTNLRVRKLAVSVIKDSVQCSIPASTGGHLKQQYEGLEKNNYYNFYFSYRVSQKRTLQRFNLNFKSFKCFWGHPENTTLKKVLKL